MSKNQSSDLLIVVVNYFMADDCCKLIESILSSETRSLQRIVCVDNSCNHSELQQLRLLEQKILETRVTNVETPKLLIQANTNNLGFGSAINRVVKEQLNLNNSLQKILLINPDVELLPNSIDSLLNGSKQLAEAGIWGGVTVDADGKADGFHAWRAPTLVREFAWALGLTKLLPIDAFVNHYGNKHERKIDSTHYAVDAVSGCFMLIDTELWESLSGFDERFFLYSEEIDLCQRARAIGARPQVVNSATLKHVRGTSKPSFFRMKMLINSKLLYWQKHHGPMFKFIVQKLYSVAYLMRGGVFYCREKTRLKAKIYLILSVNLFLNKDMNKPEGRDDSTY